MGSLAKTLFRSAISLSTREIAQVDKGVFQNVLITCPTKSFLDVRLMGIGIRHVSSSSTLNYRAAVLREVGQPLVLEEVPRKSLKKGEVRVGVYCCGINSIDRLTVSGGIDVPPTLPIVPGYEISGEILEVGEEDDDSKGFKPGQRVIGMHSRFQGGFAEEVVISGKDLWTVNDSLSFETGATLVNSYGTALLALSRRAEVKKGDSVLVTGAGGKLGLAAVDLAANVYKCKVIALCVSDDKATAVRERGAFATLIAGKQDWVPEVKKVNDGKGVQIIIDPVGGEIFKKAVQCAEDEGKVIVTGFASKNIPQIGADELVENSFSIVGVSLDQYRKKKFDVYRDVVSEVIEMADENLIKPFKAKHYSLDDVNEALESLKNPNSIGKYVINVK